MNHCILSAFQVSVKKPLPRRLGRDANPRPPTFFFVLTSSDVFSSKQEVVGLNPAHDAVDVHHILIKHFNTQCFIHTVLGQNQNYC